MIYQTIIYAVSNGFVYALAPYFIFILWGASGRYKVHSFILIFYAFLCCKILDIHIMEEALNRDFQNSVRICLLIEGVTALIMVATMSLDKLNKFYAVILLFAVLCHTMLLCSLNKETVSLLFIAPVLLVIAEGFHYLYLELLILVYIAMIGISYNGFMEAVHTVRNDVRLSCLWANVFYHRWCPSLLRLEKREEKT